MPTPEDATPTSDANPWAALPDAPPFVLPADRAAVAAWNDAPGRSPLHRLQLDVLPEPYIGRPDAPIVLLRLHPGYGPGDVRFTADARCREIWRHNALHEPLPVPFYPLDPLLAWTEVAGWWRQRLGRLIDRFGERLVADNLLVVSATPYHSLRFPGTRGRMASQQYGHRLVERALAREAIVLMANRPTVWYRAVPALEGYPHLHLARVRHGGYVTPGIYPDGYPELERILAARQPRD